MIAFTVWEIDFPDDDEDYRGVSEKLANAMVDDGLIALTREGIVTNVYGEKVYTLGYTPVTGREAEAWERFCDQ